MTNLYEAGELLSNISLIVESAKNKKIIQTPDGRPPVYWPVTIHGVSGMISSDKALYSDANDGTPKTGISQHENAQTNSSK